MKVPTCGHTQPDETCRTCKVFDWPFPRVPYRLTEADRNMLRTMRINPDLWPSQVGE